MNRTILAWVIVCGASSLLAGCGGAADYEESVGQASEEVARPNGVPLWPNGIVPYCWDSTAASHPRFAELSARVAEVVTDHYARAANIHFEDAGRCPTDATGVLRISENAGGGGNVWPLGYFNNSATPMNLDFDSGWFNGAQAQYQQLIMHEFMHSLGFEHEFLRPDWPVPPGGCNPGGADLAPGWSSHGTTVDPNSITASTYCTTRTILSSTDVSGLQNAYGTPGKQRIDAAATDTGQDLMYHRWTGSTWTWSELFANQDDINGRPDLASLRVGANEHVRVYSLTSGGHLVQQHFNGSSWSRTKWVDRVADLPPAVVAFRDYGTGPNGSYSESKGKWYAFTRAASGAVGSLMAMHYNGTSSSWVDFGKPAGGDIQQVDAVTFSDYGAKNAWIYAFVKAQNGEIYARYGNPTPSTWSGSLGKPSLGSIGPITASTTRQCISGGCAQDVHRSIHVFTVANGTMWNLFWNGFNWSWGDLGKPAGVTLKQVKPSVASWTTFGSIRYDVFILDTNDNLHQLNWNGGAWVWNPNGSHGKPTGVSSVIGGPSVVTTRIPTLPSNVNDVTTTQNARYAFIVGNDNKAYVRFTGDGVNWQWADQTSPYGNPAIANSRGITAIAYWGR